MGLSKAEKSELLSRLDHESRTMLNSFATLVTHTQKQLCHSETTTEELKTWFIERELKKLARQIKSTDAIPAILNKVKEGNYWSFFNYELLETMIKCFCKGTPLIAELQDYVSKFKVYCQRRVSKVPRGCLNCEHKDESMNFIVKMDNNFHIQKTNLEKIKKIQYQLQDILKIELLQLIDVKDGCIELTFRYFDNAITKMFWNPLEEEEEAALLKIGVQQLFCGKEVVLKTKQPLKGDYTQPPSSAPLTKIIIFLPQVITPNHLPVHQRLLLPLQQVTPLYSIMHQ